MEGEKSVTLLALEPKAQQYDWGQRGRDSKVLQLLLANQDWLHSLNVASPSSSPNGNGAENDSQQPWAELWMGTHERGPSVVHESGNARGVPLSEWITTSKRTRKGEGEGEGEVLPFLFKVLSVRTPLSIQAHPDKELAQILHGAEPSLYPDPNHKPELACALTPFEALVGFLPLSEIADNISDIAPELGALLSECCDISHTLSQCQSLRGLDRGRCEEIEKKILKELFGALMTASSSSVSRHLETLVRRFADLETSVDPLAQPLSDRWLQAKIDEIETDRQHNKTDNDNDNDHDQEKEKIIRDRLLRLRVLRVHSFFPGDVGVFCLFMLRSVRLDPGEAVYLGPNEPHCYLHGDCIECMACSDNVVRAGLTPKYRDASTLVSMLTYRVDQSHRVSPLLLSPVDHVQGSLWMYETEAEREFILFKASVSPSSLFDLGHWISLTVSRRLGLLGPSVLLVIEGEGSLESSSSSSSSSSRSSISLRSGSVVFVDPPEGISSLAGLAVHAGASPITLFACSYRAE